VHQIQQAYGQQTSDRDSTLEDADTVLGKIAFILDAYGKNVYQCLLDEMTTSAGEGANFLKSFELKTLLENILKSTKSATAVTGEKLSQATSMIDEHYRTIAHYYFKNRLYASLADNSSGEYQGFTDVNEFLGKCSPIFHYYDRRRNRGTQEEGGAVALTDLEAKMAKLFVKLRMMRESSSSTVKKETWQYVQHVIDEYAKLLASIAQQVTDGAHRIKTPSALAMSKQSANRYVLNIFLSFSLVLLLTQACSWRGRKFNLHLTFFACLLSNCQNDFLVQPPN
jgi:hypothetical protein